MAKWWWSNAIQISGNCQLFKMIFWGCCLIVPTFGLSLKRGRNHFTDWSVAKLCALHSHLRLFSPKLSSGFESPLLSSLSGELHHLLPVHNRLHGAFCHNARRTGLQTLCWYHHDNDLDGDGDRDGPIYSTNQHYPLPQLLFDPWKCWCSDCLTMFRFMLKRLFVHFPNQKDYLWFQISMVRTTKQQWDMPMCYNLIDPIFRMMLFTWFFSVIVIAMCYDVIDMFFSAVAVQVYTGAAGTYMTITAHS